jgi:hypothetical protein
VVATSALSTVSATEALTHLAESAGDAGAFDREVLEHVLRACAREALRRRADERGASWVLLAASADERASEQRALDAAVERVCEGLARASVRSDTMVRVLLGREGDAGRASAAFAVTEPWLSPAMRVRALGVALANERLEARAIALGELEARGVVAGVLALLREVARTDADPITRQHARQLARGTTLPE